MSHDNALTHFALFPGAKQIQSVLRETQTWQQIQFHSQLNNSSWDLIQFQDLVIVDLV